MAHKLIYNGREKAMAADVDAYVNQPEIADIVTPTEWHNDWPEYVLGDTLEDSEKFRDLLLSVVDELESFKRFHGDEYKLKSSVRLNWYYARLSQFIAENFVATGKTADWLRGKDE